MMRQTMQKALGTLAGLSALSLLAVLPIPMAGAQEVGGGSPGNAPSREALKNVLRLQETRVVTATGQEDWSALTGFGPDAEMAEMMTLMMVGGSGMEHMTMGPMKPGVRRADMPKGSADLSQGMPITVTLSPNPPVVGQNALDILVTDAGGKPVTGLKLLASVAMTSMDMGTARPKVTEGKEGHYAVIATFSMKGPWRVNMTVAPPRQKPIIKAFDFTVK